MIVSWFVNKQNVKKDFQGERISETAVECVSEKV